MEPFQNGRGGKWKERARIGVYLGLLPKHARSVALVLNPSTGLVSPQWHVKYDDMFMTSKEHKHTSHWKSLTGLEKIVHDIPRAAYVEQGLNGSDENIIQKFAKNLANGTFSNSDMPNMPEPEGDVEMMDEQDATVMPEPEGGTEVAPKRKKEKFQIFGIEDEQWALPSELELCKAYNEEDCPDLDHPLVFAAKSDPDTFYYGQAMKQPDSHKFRQAMQQEIDDHTNNKHWKVRKRKEMPPGTTVLPAVWAMKRKRRIMSQEVYKWKARLNVHGGKQIYGVHYWETFSPVVTWLSIRLFLVLSIVCGWHTRQVDFVMAYPQAPIEKTIYMELPAGVEVTTGNPKDYVLELEKNLYGQKQAGRVWTQYLTNKLIKLKFEQSKVDECVFYRNSTVFLVYVDDGILIGPSKDEIDKIIKELQQVLKMTDEGDLKDYLGVNVEKRNDGSIKLSQPHLIDQIIRDVNF